LLTLRRDDKLNEAKRDFERVHQLVPNDPEPVANLAIIARRQGRNEDAITGLTRALAMGSTMTRLYFARADARRDVGDLKGEALDRATGLNLTPTDVSSWVARAMARSERREYDKALDDIAAALKLDPNSYSALLLKTSVLAEKLKKTEEAIVVFDQIVKLNPKLAPSLAGRAVLLARLGRMEEAKRDIEEALRLELQGPIYYKAACVHALTSRQGPGDRREAVDLLEIALRKGHGSKLIEDDPDLDPIRDDPMFQSLENKVKQGLIQVSPK
jgi:tetratricopeptide (TPR) repeat protein